MTEYVKRAEAAIRSGQPRLAMLYMRRGLNESADGRAWLIWTDMWDAADRAGEAMGRLIREAFPAGREAFPDLGGRRS